MNVWQSTTYGVVSPSLNTPLACHVALTSSVQHIHRFHVQTHLQQISTDAISVHFIYHSLKISFQHRNPCEHSSHPFNLWSCKKKNSLLLFGLQQETSLCFLAGYKKPFCGIIVAFQSAKETSFKPIISHMEGARGLSGCCWMGAKSSRR